MNYTSATLKTSDPKDWYVYYTYFNPETGRMEPFKRRDGINRIKDKKEKKRVGELLAVATNRDLADGIIAPYGKLDIKILNPDFYWWFQERLNYTKSKHGLYNWKKLNNVFNRLKEFSPTLLNSQITYKFLQDYEKHLIERGNTPNTVADNLTRVKIVYGDLVKSGAVEYHKNPFLKYKFTKKRVVKKRLSLEEIQKLENAELEGLRNIARDMYILSFYCAGIRFGDLCRLKKDNFSTHLRYTMHKTDIERNIKIVPQAKKIIEKYIKTPGIYLFDTKFDPENEDQSINAKNSLYNKYLKLVCNYLEIAELTFHTARNSFADYCKKTGLDIHTIKELLGHGKVSTTEIYMKAIYHEESEQAMDKLFITEKSS